MESLLEVIGELKEVVWEKYKVDNQADKNFVAALYGLTPDELNSKQNEVLFGVLKEFTVLLKPNEELKSTDSFYYAHKAQERALRSARANNRARDQKIGKVNNIRIRDYYDDTKWYTAEELAIIKEVERQLSPSSFSRVSMASEGDLASYYKYMEALKVKERERFKKKKALLAERGIKYESPQERALRYNIVL